MDDSGSINEDAGFEAFYESYVPDDDEQRWWVRYGMDVDGISEERTYDNPSFDMFDDLATGNRCDVRIYCDCYSRHRCYNLD